MVCVFILITRAKRNKRINQHFKGELKETMSDYLFIYSFILFQRHSNALCSQSKIVYGIKASVGGISQGSGSLVSPSNLMCREEQGRMHMIKQKQAQAPSACWSQRTISEFCSFSPLTHMPPSIISVLSES